MPIQERRPAVPAGWGLKVLDMGIATAALEKEVDSLASGDFAGVNRILSQAARNLKTAKVFPEVCAFTRGVEGFVPLLRVRDDAQAEGHFWLFTRGGSLVEASLLENDAVDLDNARTARPEEKERLASKIVKLVRSTITEAYAEAAGARKPSV